MTTTAAAATVPITLDLHAELYPRAAVDRAITAFAAAGDFSIAVVGSYLRVTIRPIARAVTLGHEFANYVLAEAVVGGPGDVSSAADEPSPAGTP